MLPLSATAAPPDHYYAWHRNGAYGYELEQTEFAREHTPEAPTINYWYEGQVGGVYRLRQFNGAYVDMIRCAAPCTSVRIINAQVDKSLIVRPGTALWAAVEDMTHGRLDVHR